MPTQDYWNKRHNKYLSEDWITKPTIFATQVVQYFPPKARILELGCGQGQDTTYFVDQGFVVTACDFSQFALDQAKLRTKADFKLVNMNSPLEFQRERASM